MVNSHGFIIHKANHHKKGRIHDYDIYKINHPVTPKVVVNMFDLGYLGIEKDFPQNNYHLYRIESKEIWIYRKKKKRENKIHSRTRIVGNILSAD